MSSCTPGFDDSVPPAVLQSSNQGYVFINLAYRDAPCSHGNIFLATEPTPGRFQFHSAPMTGGTVQATTSARQIALPAGTYHVGYVQCFVDGRAAIVGDTDGAIVQANPLQSLGRFTVSAGEAVNVGQVNLMPTDYLAHRATVVITDLSADAMQRLRAGVPKLSSKLVTRLMTQASPGQSYKISWVQAGRG